MEVAKTRTETAWTRSVMAWTSTGMGRRRTANARNGNCAHENGGGLLIWLMLMLMLLLFVSLLLSMTVLMVRGVVMMDHRITILLYAAQRIWSSPWSSPWLWGSLDSSVSRRGKVIGDNSDRACRPAPSVAVLTPTAARRRRSRPNNACSGLRRYDLRCSSSPSSLLLLK